MLRCSEPGADILWRIAMRTQFGALALAMAAGITVLPHAAGPICESPVRPRGGVFLLGAKPELCRGKWSLQKESYPSSTWSSDTPQLSYVRIVRRAP
jgi:hypothetical protein